MSSYSIRDKAWNWPEKWRRWKIDFARSERAPEPWEATLLGWDGQADLEPEVLARLAAWDWDQYKLEQLSELRGYTFWKRGYRPSTSDWESDHCLGCWAKFDAQHSEERNVLHEAYVTYVRRDVPAKLLYLTIEPPEDGMAAEWVCKTCFDQFRQALGFTLAEP